MSNNPNTNGANQSSFRLPSITSNDINQRRNSLNNFYQNWNSFMDSHLPPFSPLSLPQTIGHNNNIISNNNNNGSDFKTDLNDNTNNIEKELRIQIKRLQQQNIELKEQISKQQKEIHKYKLLYTNSNILKDSYHLRLTALAKMIKSGPNPQYNLVKMNKNTEEMCTQNVYKYKQIINKYYKQKYQNKEYYVNIVTKDNKKLLKNIIYNHIKINKINNSKPNLLIKTQNKNMYSQIPYNAIIEKFVIKDHRIKALIGQRGIRALGLIPKATVIGQYIGIEYLYKEYNDIFSHSNEEDVRNIYAFDCDLNVPVVGNNPDNDDNDVKMDNDYDIDIDFRNEKLVIDGYGLRERILMKSKDPKQHSTYLLYINDCRLNIKNEEPSNDDYKYWNTDFVEATVNGWPMIFLVTRRDVKCNEELMGFYGESYHLSLDQFTKWESMKSCIQTLVDQSVLQGVDLTKNHYVLE